MHTCTNTHTSFGGRKFGAAGPYVWKIYHYTCDMTFFSDEQFKQLLKMCSLADHGTLTVTASYLLLINILTDITSQVTQKLPKSDPPVVEQGSINELYKTLPFLWGARWCNGKAFGLAISRLQVQILLEATLRNNLRQVVYTYVPLSPSCITWYRPKGGDALRLGR